MHIGIIMDGNGRWAVQRNLPRAFGHKRGASKVTEIVKSCPNLGIKTLTLYAFSTENWKRAAHEVESLMKLFRGYLQNKFLELVNNNVRVIFLGDPKPIAQDIIIQMRKLEKATKYNDGLILNIALNYGGRDEIVRATKKVVLDFQSRNISLNDLTQEKYEEYLDTRNQKSPEIIIRTAGQKRISNFLLWQISYSELFFSDTNWPDFTVTELEKIIENFLLRNRTYGNIKNNYADVGSK